MSPEHTMENPESYENIQKELDQTLARKATRHKEIEALERKLDLATAALAAATNEVVRPPETVIVPPVKIEKSSTAERLAEGKDVPPAEPPKPFEEFGISKDELDRVPGFTDLSDDQKAFVLDSLRRVLYGDVETKAKALLAEETSKLSVVHRTGRKAFEGFAGQGGKLRVKELEVLQAIRAGGIAAHGETLRLLVQMTAGHEIITNPDTGAREVAYINSDEFTPPHRIGETPEEYAKALLHNKEVVANYNKAARQFAETPEVWGYSGASKKERAQHEAARLEYDNARRAMFAIAHAKIGDFALTSEFMLQHDSQVTQERILAGCPQLEAVLNTVSRIETESRQMAGAKTTAKESGLKGGIAGGSFLTRYGSITILGFSALPVAIAIGSGVNGIRAAFQARTKAREEFLTAQEDLTRKEKASLKTGRTFFGIGKKERGRLAGHAFRKTDFIDASNYNKRIQSLLEKINDPANERNALNQRHLQRLVTMAEAHLAEGLVNFGKEKTRLFAAHEFATNLAQARVELARQHWTDQKSAIPNLTYADANGKPQKISLPDFLEAKTERMSKEQKKFILRGFTRGLAVGAVAGGVGALFGAWVKDTFFSKADVPGGNTPSAPENLPVAPDAKDIPVPPRSPAPIETTPGRTGATKTPAIYPGSSPHAQPGGQTNMNPHSFVLGPDAPPYPDIAINKPPEIPVPSSSAPTETVPGRAGGGRPNVANEVLFAETQQNAVEVVPPASPLETNAEYAKLSEIKKGEGMWHAVRRQLNYQMTHISPEEFAKRYGLTPEDIQKNPKQSVERITGKLLIDQNYIKPNGGGSEQLVKEENTYQWRKPGGAWTETRIAKPGVHVTLDENGKIEIADTGKTVKPASKNPTPIDSSPQQPSGKPANTSDLQKVLEGAEEAMKKTEAAASHAETSLNKQKIAPNLSPNTTPNTNIPPTYGGRKEDFISSPSANEPVFTRTPIGADKFGIGAESGLLQDGSPGATTEEYKALRGIGPADNEFRKGFAPDRAPATELLNDAQRDALQLSYNDLPPKGMGEGMGGGTKEVSPIDPMGLGDEMMRRSGVFPHPETFTPNTTPPATEILTDAQREALQLEYQGLPPKGAGEVMGKEATSLLEPLTHVIGKRGPEGAIIDEFRGNPELAKQFGWDGKKNINAWAGKEADTLYKAYQKQSLGNPKIVQEMERLGYKPTPKGHESMMHRIKSGTIELDPKTKSLTLKNMNIIKAGDTMTLLSEAENTTRKMAGIPLEKYADVRDMSLAEFLKKPPRGKGLELLADVLHEAKPTKTDMQKGIGEYLTGRFGK